MKLSLAISPCPNDTFIFDAMVHGRVDTEGLEFDLHFADISDLNRMALAGTPDVVKVSYRTFADLMPQYRLLDAGSALGYGCGPLLLSRTPMDGEAFSRLRPEVVIPGKMTTAYLLLRYYAPWLEQVQERVFDEIIPEMVRGTFAAGLVIHESRFTYAAAGLHCVQDLGAYWEAQTGMPIPLGGILARKSLGDGTVAAVDRVLRRSVEYAFAHREASRDFVAAHAQEMDAAVCAQHIALYVNDFSVSLGEKGYAAVRSFLEAGEARGLLAAGTATRFREEYAGAGAAGF